MILAVMNAIYAITYIKAWKFQDFNGVWTRNRVAIWVRRSHQLSYEATAVRCWLFVVSNEPVRDEWEFINEIFHILNGGCEMNVIYAITYIEAWKIRDFNLIFQNCLNCVHNWEDYSLLDFTSVVQYMKYFICNLTQNRVLSFQSLVYQKYV